MRKYGYKEGKGLGKREDGITEPIQGNRKVTFCNDQPSKDSWPKNTVLFAGDSMYNNIDEKRIGRNVKRNVKVRAHPGATTQDMQHHLTALLRKQPSHLVLHVGANDASNDDKRAEDIVNEILELKHFAESLVSGIKVAISCPITRTDNHKANVKVIHIRALLRTSGINDIIVNDNIGVDMLGKKGLHLSNKGVGNLARNMIEYLKSL